MYYNGTFFLLLSNTVYFILLIVCIAFIIKMYNEKCGDVPLKNSSITQCPDFTDQCEHRHDNTNFNRYWRMHVSNRTVGSPAALLACQCCHLIIVRCSQSMLQQHQQH